MSTVDSGPVMTDKGDPFEEPFIEYHRQQAQLGNEDSAQWLARNVAKAIARGEGISPYLQWTVQRLKAGGLRRNMQEARDKKPGQRGKAKFTDTRSLLLAIEVWRRMRERKIAKALAIFDLSIENELQPDILRKAYDRFCTRAGGTAADKRAFSAELRRFYWDNPNDWRRLVQTYGSESEARAALPPLT